MISSLRARFNSSFTPEKYQRFLRTMDERAGVPIKFRLSETPCFFPKSLLDEMGRDGEILIRQLARQALALVGLDVEEHHIGFLLRKAPHDRSANSRCTTGDENDLAGEVGINGGHGHLPACLRAKRRAARLSRRP